MKKKVFATMMAAVTVVLVVSGCSNKTTQGNKGGSTEVVDTLAESTEALVDEEELKAQCLARAQYGDILNEADWSDEPLAPNAIIDDYLSGRQEYLGQYYELLENSLVAAVYLGDEHVTRRRYYPEATCSGTLTAEDLIKDYADQTLPWADSNYGGSSFLYTEDYRSCYEIHDNWLWADGVKVYPVGQIMLDVEPANVLYDYQHGLWDGTVPAFSYGYGTMVKVDRFYGTLEYEYEALEYAKGFDQRDLAYEQYDDPLTFMVTGEDPLGADGEFEADDFNTYDYDFEGAYTGRYYRATVEVYLDLPNGRKDGFENLLHLEYAGPEVGMYVIMSDKIELYRRGVLLETWPCEVTTTNPILWCQSDQTAFAGEVHVQISDDEIVRLLPDGKTETVIDGLTGDIFSVGEYAVMQLSLKNGELRGYNCYCGIVEIADNIATIDYTHHLMLMTDNEGVVYAFEADDYMVLENQSREAIESGKQPEGTLTIYRLGTEPWEQYLKLYEAGLLELCVG